MENWNPQEIQGATDRTFQIIFHRLSGVSIPGFTRAVNESQD